MSMADFEHCYLLDDDYLMNNQMIVVENYNHLDDDHDQNDFLLKLKNKNKKRNYLQIFQLRYFYSVYRLEPFRSEIQPIGSRIFFGFRFFRLGPQPGLSPGSLDHNKLSHIFTNLVNE